MFHRRYLLIAVGVTVALITPSLLAGIIVDDHFVGESSGVPANWVKVVDNGTVVESGTLVAISDATGSATALQSTAIFNPQVTTTTIVANIESIGGSPTGNALIALTDNPFAGVYFDVAIGKLGEVQVIADLDGSDMDIASLGTIAGYSGGAIEVTATLGFTNFSVQTDVGGLVFDGTYTAAGITQFANISGLGTLVSPTLATLGANTTVSYDRIQVTTSDAQGGGGAAVPEP